MIKFLIQRPIAVLLTKPRQSLLIVPEIIFQFSVRSGKFDFRFSLQRCTDIGFRGNRNKIAEPQKNAKS